MNKQSEISEAFGCDQIVKAFKPVFPEARVMQNIIMPMDGFGHCPTAEFDVIVVCSAGVFPFEIKGHIGKSIEISKAENGAHYWKIHKSHGAVEIQDPLAQSGRKIKYLRESIKSCLVRGFVYFTNQEITLPPNANADVITTGDLPYLVRSLRQEAKRREKLLPETDVSRIADAIHELSQEHTMEEHIINCKKTGEFKRLNGSTNGRRHPPAEKALRNASVARKGSNESRVVQ